MTPKKYQKEIEKTWISQGDNKDLNRVGFGISGEAGEIAEKFKKRLRGDFLYTEFRNLVKAEIGDLSYYIAKLCNILGLDWGKILDENIAELKDRKERGVIKGSGDNR